MSDLTCTDFLRTFARTTGARIYANSGLLDQYPVGTALHARVEEEVARDIKEFVEVCATTHGRCRRNFFEASELKTLRSVRAARATRAASTRPGRPLGGRRPPPQGGRRAAAGRRRKGGRRPAGRPLAARGRRELHVCCREPRQRKRAEFGEIKTRNPALPQPAL